MRISLSEAEQVVFASNKQTSSRGKTACLTRLQPVQPRRQQHNDREAIILLFMAITSCPWCNSVISQELTVDEVQRFGSQCMFPFYLWCLSVVKVGPSLSQSLGLVMYFGPTDCLMMGGNALPLLSTKCIMLIRLWRRWDLVFSHFNAHLDVKMFLFAQPGRWFSFSFWHDKAFV